MMKAREGQRNAFIDEIKREIYQTRSRGKYLVLTIWNCKSS